MGCPAWIGGDPESGLAPLGPSSPKEQWRWLCSTFSRKLKSYRMQNERQETQIRKTGQGSSAFLSKMHSEKKQRFSLLSQMDSPMRVRNIGSSCTSARRSKRYSRSILRISCRGPTWKLKLNEKVMSQ